MGRAIEYIAWFDHSYDQIWGDQVYQITMIKYIKCGMVNYDRNIKYEAIEIWPRGQIYQYGLRHPFLTNLQMRLLQAEEG